MLTLTGIAETRRPSPLRDTARGFAILGLCFVLAAAFAATVWHGPAAPTPAARPAIVASR
ncbi:MAG TPA: hypothetical protein VFG59_19050 [Anaeromyxobacter sp.]|nr:hypothetical protein [Anaeromyxobacter sp.]